MSITSPRPSRAAQSRVIAQDRSIDISPLVNPKSESGYLGVSRHHRGKAWLAKFKADGRLFRVGVAKSPEGAARILAAHFRDLYGESWPVAVQSRKRQPYRIWEDGCGWRAAVYVLGKPLIVTGKLIGLAAEVSPGIWDSRDSARLAVKMALRKWKGRLRAVLLRG